MDRCDLALRGSLGDDGLFFLEILPRDDNDGRFLHASAAAAASSASSAFFLVLSSSFTDTSMQSCV
jgi:hypothetical protein